MPTTTTQQAHTPYLPTLIETALYALYPTTLLLGSLFSHLSPSLRAPYNLSVYSHAHQSFQPANLAPSYFATKRNIFNLYFVKVGWFWVTVALGLFTLLAARGRAHISIGLKHRRGPEAKRLQDMDATAARTERDARLRRIYQVLLRWGLVTLAWALTTQWLLGASFIDRVFTLTGGACQLAHAEAQTPDPSRLEKLAGVASYAACRGMSGRWAGGMDISGHVFLLVLGSGMLALEILPIILPWVRGLTDYRVVRTAGGGTTTLAGLQHASEPDIWHFPSAPPAQPPRTPGGSKSRIQAADARAVGYTGLKLKSYGVGVALAVVGLSWWMLLMTAAFFHTWVEKSGACVLAGVVLWGVYVAPRGVFGVREVVGLPGL